MACKHQTGRTRANTGVEVIDIRRIGIREADDVALKPCFLQNPMQKMQSPAFFRRYRRAADKGLG